MPAPKSIRVRPRRLPDGEPVRIPRRPLLVIRPGPDGWVNAIDPDGEDMADDLYLWRLLRDGDVELVEPGERALAPKPKTKSKRVKGDAQKADTTDEKEG